MQRPARTSLNKHCVLALAVLAAALIVSLADGFIARNYQYHFLPGELRRIVSWSEIFAHGMGVAVIILGVIVLAPDLRRYVPRLIACPLLAGLAAAGLKYFAQRTRPLAMYEMLDTTAGQSSVGWGREFDGRIEQLSYNFQSFPSGHAATAFGFAVGMSWLIPRGRWYFFGLAILAGSQRSVSLAHWTSDVFAGAAVGIVVAGIVTGTKFCDRFYGMFEQVRSEENDDLKPIESTPTGERTAA